MKLHLYIQITFKKGIQKHFILKNKHKKYPTTKPPTNIITTNNNKF